MIIDGVEQLDVPTAEQRLRDGWLLLDVRDAEEHAQARIPGSVFIPLSQIAQREGELPRDRPILVHCAGGARSHAAARFLQQRGHQAANLAHGITGWYRMGRPVDTGPA